MAAVIMEHDEYMIMRTTQDNLRMQVSALQAANDTLRAENADLKADLQQNWGLSSTILELRAANEQLRTENETMKAGLREIIPTIREAKECISELRTENTRLRIIAMINKHYGGAT